MPRPLHKKDIEILEERGLWKASSYLHRIVRRLIRKNAPLEMRYIKEAHRIALTYQPEIAGKYRRHNGPELKRIDGTILEMTDWRQIPNAMAELDIELRERTKNLTQPKDEKEYRLVIREATELSHRLASIHPFENGNGRASRLLLNAVLLLAGLPEIAIKKTKVKYLRAMRQADDGDFTMLEDMISNALFEAKEKVYKVLLKKRAQLGKKKKGHKYR